MQTGKSVDKSSIYKIQKTEKSYFHIFFFTILGKKISDQLTIGTE